MELTCPSGFFFLLACFYSCINGNSCSSNVPHLVRDRNPV